MTNDDHDESENRNVEIVKIMMTTSTKSDHNDDVDADKHDDCYFISCIYDDDL
jgi:hypothetical protein